METQHTKNTYAKGVYIMAEGKIGGIGQSFVMDSQTYPKEGFVDVESEANAKLWAEAPKMFDKLSRIKALIESYKKKLKQLTEIIEDIEYNEDALRLEKYKERAANYRSIISELEIAIS